MAPAGVGSLRYLSLLLLTSCIYCQGAVVKNYRLFKKAHVLSKSEIRFGLVWLKRVSGPTSSILRIPHSPRVHKTSCCRGLKTRAGKPGVYLSWMVFYKSVSGQTCYFGRDKTLSFIKVSWIGLRSLYLQKRRTWFHCSREGLEDS